MSRTICHRNSDYPIVAFCLDVRQLALLHPISPEFAQTMSALDGWQELPSERDTGSGDHHLQQREGRADQQLTDRAELRAAMAGYADGRHEAEEMRAILSPTRPASTRRAVPAAKGIFVSDWTPPNSAPFRYLRAPERRARFR